MKILLARSLVDYSRLQDGRSLTIGNRQQSMGLAHLFEKVFRNPCTNNPTSGFKDEFSVLSETGRVVIEICLSVSKCLKKWVDLKNFVFESVTRLTSLASTQVCDMSNDVPGESSRHKKRTNAEHHTPLRTLHSPSCLHPILRTQ